MLRGRCAACEAKSPRKQAEERRRRVRDPRVKAWYDSERWRRICAGHLRNHPLCVGYPSGAVHVTTRRFGTGNGKDCVSRVTRARLREKMAGLGVR